LTNPDGSLAWRATFPPILYMSHCTGPLLTILGEPFVEAFAYGARPSTQRWPRDATQAALFKTRSGAVCRMTNQFDTLIRPPLEYVSIYGTKGCYEQARAKGARDRLFLQGFSGFAEVALDDPERTPIPAEGGHSGGEVLIVCEFIDAIGGRREVSLDVRVAVEMSLPGICAAESVKTGQPVRIPIL